MNKLAFCYKLYHKRMLLMKMIMMTKVKKEGLKTELRVVQCRLKKVESN